MATRILQWVQKASFTTGDLTGGAKGGYLSPEQAQVFLRDAVEETVVLKASDVFDSKNPIFEIPKFSFGDQIMHAGVEGTRGTQSTPDTGLVTLTTKLFKGEVAVSDETFEDNVERGGFADTMATSIAAAVGRDFEDLALRSNAADSGDFATLGDGIVQQLVVADVNVEDVSGAVSYKALFKQMLTALPTRYRSRLGSLVFYVPIVAQDDWADELSDRGTLLGDSATTERTNLRYRGIDVIGVPLLTGTKHSYDYSTVVMLCDPKNVKTGFHREVRLEKWREPREGQTYFLPTARFDVKWAQDSAVVLGTGNDLSA